MNLYLLGITGVLAGALGGLLGLGGGVFLVPALTLFFGVPIELAVGTSLVGVIATSAGTAAVAPPGKGADTRLALRLELATAAGAIVGSILARFSQPVALGVLYAVVVFAAAAYLLIKERQPQPSDEPERLFGHSYRPRHWPAGLGLASMAGAISGLLGVGGGFIKVPIMYAVMGVPLGVATATSNMMVGITAAASVFIYFNRGDIEPRLTIPVATGVLLGAVLGERLEIHTRVAWLRTALIVLLILLGLQMLLQSLGVFTIGG